MNNSIDKMYNVALIGAGQLGSRHLQGLKKADLPMNIVVVDSSLESLHISEERYNQVPNNEYKKDVLFSQNLNDIQKNIDLAIIATGSKPRASITKSLLAHSTVGNIVFEKFLFPVLSEYDKIESLLNEKHTRAFVNCSRRMFPYYDTIQQTLDLSQPVNFSFAGLNWGLCCNAIHFIDIFLRMVEENHFNLDTSHLQNRIIDSKRSGYIELLGTLEATTPNKNKIILTSLDEYNGPSVIVIQNGNTKIVLDESNKQLCVNERQYEIDVPFTSNITNKIAETILLSNDCRLTDFHTSSIYHQQFLRPILDFYNKQLKLDGVICPIT